MDDDDLGISECSKDFPEKYKTLHTVVVIESIYNKDRNNVTVRYRCIYCNLEVSHAIQGVF